MNFALPKSQYPQLRELAEALFNILDGHIIMGSPIGIGKATQLVNALYDVAKENNQFRLDIHTALSLSKPVLKTDLEQRLLKPFFDRHFQHVPELNYMEDAKKNKLPANVNLIEFYFKPGEMLNCPKAQQQVLSANYTHIARDMVERKVNLVTQMIAKREHNGQTEYSLSSNPDVTLDLQRLMREKTAADGKARLLIGQVNTELPFMTRDARIEASFFDHIHDDPNLYTPLFCTPHQPINAIDHMIGFYTSTLVKDAGTLQIGIGSLGDAVVNALLLRHKQNAAYRQLLTNVDAIERFPIIATEGGCDTFKTGLYGNTEMLVPGYIALKQGGVLKRKVYDDLAIQSLVNRGMDPTRVDIDWLLALVDIGKIEPHLTANDVTYLKHWGFFKSDVQWQRNHLCCGAEQFRADLSDLACREKVKQWALGNTIAQPTLIHAGFFVGTGRFYDDLRHLPEPERDEINMTSVAFTNQLLGNEALKIAQRQHARFINACMKTTLSGASVSDGLANGKVVSGVGGQFNFVSMAHDIPEARSILMMRSWRHKGKSIISNIVFNYGHTTIPRHMRDIIVTEYGIADLRAKNDQEIIEELLKITDSRFQSKLIKQAKKAHKLPQTYSLPEYAKNNLPSRVNNLAKQNQLNLFPTFPFGKELTDQEIIIASALNRIKARLTAIWPLIPALLIPSPKTKVVENQMHLERMGLSQPHSLKERVFRKLLLADLPSVKPASTRLAEQRKQLPD